MEEIKLWKLGRAAVLILVALVSTPRVYGQSGLLVSSFQTNDVRLYSSASGSVTQMIFVAPNLGGLLEPTGLTFDAQGNLYVSSSVYSGSGAVLEYDKTGAFVKVLVPPDPSGLLVYPEAITFGPDGNLYVANNRSAATTNTSCLGDVLRFDGKTGALIDEFVPCSASGGLVDPLDLTFGPDGNLYVSSPLVNGYTGGSVLRFDGKTGSFIDYFVKPGDNNLALPWGITFGPDFNLYVTNDVANSVMRFDGRKGTFIDNFVSTGVCQSSGPTGLVFGPDMNLYVGCDTGSTSAVKRYNGQTGAYIDDYVKSSTGLQFPTFLAFTQDQSCPQSVRDSDGDGIPDCWELNGVDINGSHFTFPGANPYHKDIYVEIDWMPGWQPAQSALNAVTASFANAPVQNPDGTAGINLHLELDEQINNTPAYPNNQNITFDGNCGSYVTNGTPDFKDLENQWFGTAAERSDPNAAALLKVKAAVYHYAIFAYELLISSGPGVTGCAALPGREFVVTLGAWAYGNTSSTQAASLMHELGHNLNLWHGGLLDDPGSGKTYNCKPNYLSVMNYTFEYDGAWVNSRPLDYSRAALITLDKSDLNDANGIGGVPGAYTAYTCPDGQTVKTNVDASGGIDWACDRSLTETGIVNYDINYIYYNNSSGNIVPLCMGDGVKLLGFNDWANVLLNFGGLAAYAGGAPVGMGTPDIELTYEAVSRSSPGVPLTITANNVSRAYGAADPAFTVSYSSNGSLVNPDMSELSGTLLCSAGETESSPVGTYAINCSGLGSIYYNITYVPGTLTVTPALLTITSSNSTKTLNAPNPTFNWSASGFVNGENTSVLTANPSCTTTAITTSPVGSYPISCSGATAANYVFSYVAGTLRILYATSIGHVIQPPINADGSSVFNQRRTVPAKFNVYDANGVPIGTPGVVSSFFLTSIISGTVTATVEDVVDTNNPDTSFRWDGQEWIFNITTANLSAGSTYVYTIALNDGSTIMFQYGLR